MTFPVYKKYPSGEIVKICGEDLMIHVHVRKSGSDISVHRSRGLVYAILNFETNSVPTTRDEFEKDYGEAQFHLQKAMTIV